MPPTTQEFEKLIALRRCLRGLEADDGTAATDFLALLPGLREVFGPALPPPVHRHLEAIESALRDAYATPDGIREHAHAISKALGMASEIHAG